MKNLFLAILLVLAVSQPVLAQLSTEARDSLCNPYFEHNRFIKTEFGGRDNPEIFNYIVNIERTGDTIKVYLAATNGPKKYFALQVAHDMYAPTMELGPTGAWNFTNSPTATTFRITPFAPYGVMSGNITFPGEELVISHIPTLIYKGFITPTGFDIYRPLSKLFVFDGEVAVDVSNETSFNLLTGVSSVSSEVPSSYPLKQNYPNPFNPVTQIRFDIPVSGNVDLRVYDNVGREVKTIVNGFKEAGFYTVEFNGSDYASGVYYYRIETGGNIDTKKMVILK